MNIFIFTGIGLITLGFAFFSGKWIVSKLEKYDLEYFTIPVMFIIVGIIFVILGIIFKNNLY